jgi:aspartyl-tRNA(Asn)/glutamyl-tRNA(Gln) amidotransferase subunit A
VPLTGCYPLSFSLDSIGPLANSVACCATADAIMAADWDGRVPQREAKGLRLAVLKDFVLDGLSPGVEQAFSRALTALSSAGVALGEMRFPELPEIPAMNAKGGMLGAEAYFTHRSLMARSGEGYDRRVRSRMALAEAVSAADYLDYQSRRREMIRLFTDRFEGFDAVILPTTLNQAPAISELADDKDYLKFNGMSLRNTSVGNFLNTCAISIPMQALGEAPCGFMAMAPWGRDRALFGVAVAVERELAAHRG